MGLYQIIWDADSETEYEDDMNLNASEALVFILVPLNLNQKHPVEYYIIHNFSGTDHANLVPKCT